MTSPVMTSTLLGFDFYCTQPVAFYQHLCNHYLSQAFDIQRLQHTNQGLAISIDNGHLTNGQYRYRIEAQGTQPQLEQLAERIAHDFLLSAHLIKATITPLSQSNGNKAPLPLQLSTKANSTRWLSKKAHTSHNAAPIYQQTGLDYCQRCTPLFGDNQSPQFGQLDLPCSCCHGEQAYSSQPLTLAQITSLATQLMQQGKVDLRAIGIDLQLSTPSTQIHTTATLRPQVLICNPNTLSQFFQASHEQVITLSCLEKPSLTLTTQPQAAINAPRCEVRFAFNRALIVFTEYLRQQGIDWLYYHTQQPLPSMDFIHQQWLYRQRPSPIHFYAPESLHDEAVQLGYQAQMKQGLLSVRLNNTAATTPCKPEQQAINALLAARLTQPLHQQKDAACIYLSAYYPSQIVTSNSVSQSGRIEKDRPHSAFTWPQLPETGEEILQTLVNSITPSIEGNLLTQHTILDKYQHHFAERMTAIKALNLTAPTDNLHSLLIVASAVLGLSHPHSNQISIDRFITQAQQFPASHAPRIDFPQRSTANNIMSFDWCQSIKSLMSFCVAEQTEKGSDSDSHTTARLAYGLMDSLADDMTTWIEHLDQKVGIQQVLLAGEDFQYSVFSQQLIKRLCCNYVVSINPLLDLEGANLAVGALYLPQRRRR